MSQRTSRRLRLQRETLRRLASGDLAQVAGGYMARCTYEKSGCYGQNYTDDCSADCGWTGPADSDCCL